MSETPQLKKDMGLLDATSLVIGSVIGSGIFMTTGFIIGFVKSPLLVLVV